MAYRQKNRQYMKTCAVCGQAFYAFRADQTVCMGDHVMKCVICGKEFAADRRHLVTGAWRKTCSEACQKQMQHRARNGEHFEQPRGYLASSSEATGEAVEKPRGKSVSRRLFGMTDKG